MRGPREEIWLRWRKGNFIRWAWGSEIKLSELHDSNSVWGRTPHLSPQAAMKEYRGWAAKQERFSSW